MRGREGAAGKDMKGWGETRAERKRNKGRDPAAARPPSCQVKASEGPGS